ncbi:N-acetyltransferase [Thalassomonas sp. RHCl1]|uniref:GNAT family N-acetyltransferase n=1 Tax=Thalassomonas sp. RHCl1 TaxID=2995320 RepID=UPI00248CBF58|nr:N-acetyltransferase [Thalassomonas sp. RHCl1]
MSNIEYLTFEQVDPKNLMDIVNEDSLRAHLIHHPYFDITSIQTWIEDKIETDALRGCRIRVVSIDGALAGWCGIQPDENGFEIAIVISQKFWGAGIPIFKTLQCWAGELGHKEVLFHLLDTRREYKALAKMATKVCRTQLLGRSFTTYYFSVGQQNA